MTLALWPADGAWGWPTWFADSPQPPHPAVVRVIAAERDGSSLGSGCLVAVDTQHGLVVTNWHVVRDATGPITVVFPDGFRSGAVVLRTDHDWDLAALAIQRPSAAPMVLSTEPPRPGEILTIAGYGSGSYRAAAGRCTEYLSPGGNLPNEVVELDVPARLGDSGGPILNSRGEVAGVLFGAAGNAMLGGYTMGSYCGRVRTFLAAAYADFRRVPAERTAVAQAPPPSPPLPAGAIALQPVPAAALQGSLPVGSAHGSPVAAGQPVGSAGSVAAGSLAPVASSSAAPPAVSAAAEPLPTRGEQIKTILAAIGLMSILFHGIRLLGAMAG
jgi:hypothetical protein